MYHNLNRTIWLVYILIIIIGILAMYSSTHQNKPLKENVVFLKQLLWVFFGLITMFLVSSINYRRFYDSASILYGLSLFLLIVVLISGRKILGAQRWLELWVLNFQPSEFTKFTLILLLSRYFTQIYRSQYYSYRCKIIKFLKEFFVPFLFAILPTLLVFLQPDLGNAILFIFIFIAIIFLSRVDIKYTIFFIIFCLGMVPIFWGILRDYQKDRLLVFLNPNIDPLGAGYTIIQSKIAIGSGAIWGKGWLSGTQNQLNFLPERHTDFIFSVIGEEWGFIGGAILLFLYYILITSGIRVSEKTKDNFASLLALAIVSAITLQTIINLSMTLGLCPVVGLPLPLISYGGSSLIIFSALIGLLLSIYKRRIVF